MQLSHGLADTSLSVRDPSTEGWLRECPKVCQQAPFSELEAKMVAWRGSPVRLCNDVGGEFRVSLDHCVRRVPKQLPKRFEVASVAKELAREGAA